jgi:hypothetical protein
VVSGGVGLRRATLADLADITQLFRDVHGGDLDPTALLSDVRNRLYFDERGGAIFAWRGPGIYEGHSFFRPPARCAIRAGREILGLMRDARMIWGLTPESNNDARRLNRLLGFKSQGMLDTPEGRCELFVLGE